MESVYLQTGSNKGDRKGHLEFAKNQLFQISDIIELSSVYESEPWGFESILPFLNQCIKIETELKPIDLLEFIKVTEKKSGRRGNTYTYQDRELDIDILFYGDLIMNTNDLTIPHPRLHLRAFTIVPLVEIAPGFVHPVFQKSTEELLKECPDKSNPIKVW